MNKEKIKILLQFLLIVLITIAVTVVGSNAFSSAWYFILLVVYAKSKNEPFWLAFFLVTTDGFFGFLGIYSTILNIIPGMPGIEIAQFYIVIGLVKISKSKSVQAPFYKNWTILLFIYSLFLMLVGLVNGLSGELNVYFKVAKMILPLGLIYTTPRLIKTIEEYAVLFNLFFFIFMVAFAAQIYTVFTGLSPSAKFKPVAVDEMELGRNLRSYYNVSTTLVSLCGALFFLTLKDQKFFSKIYLNTIAICCFGMAFLSATRGWIISFGFIIIVYNLVISKLQIKNLAFITLVLSVLLTIALSIGKLNDQLAFAFKRSMTLEALANGDSTADGTLARLERGPPVIEAWADNPIFGWGFSDIYFEKYDVHVGNQTLLLHSGLIGLILLYSFIIYVGSKLVMVKRNNFVQNPYKSAGVVIPVFLMGWFFVHSTSVQQFGFFGVPNNIFPQAIVLALANFVVTYKV